MRINTQLIAESMDENSEIDAGNIIGLENEFKQVLAGLVPTDVMENLWNKVEKYIEDYSQQKYEEGYDSSQWEVDL